MGMTIHVEAAQKYIGKRIGDLMTNDNQLLNKNGFSADNIEKIKNGVFEDKWISADVQGNLTVITDMRNDLVLCLKDENLVALFYCYEVQHVSLNAKRGMVKVQGHETIHEYWFDDGEYHQDYTR